MSVLLKQNHQYWDKDGELWRCIYIAPHVQIISDKLSVHNEFRYLVQNVRIKTKRNWLTYDGRWSGRSPCNCDLVREKLTQTT